ncbi:MAG: transposase, partial [Synergistaceae bacterium]|nr:transposase [Synergistaceae bacterium]
GFKKLPKRRKAERTFGWFGKYRRLAKDYERLTGNSETVIMCVWKQERYTQPT